MKSAAVLFLLSCLCPLVRADLLVTVDTLCEAFPAGSSIPVYTQSHSAVFPNGLPDGTPVPGINCSTPYGSFTFGVYASQTTTGVEMQAITGLQTGPGATYSLAGTVDLRASTPLQTLVAVGGTGPAFLEGSAACGGDSGFDMAAIHVTNVFLSGPLAGPCTPGAGQTKYPIVFGQPFTYGWQGEIAFQLQTFATPGGVFGIGGFYLFDNDTVMLAPIVDQNGTPIPGARLVAVPEPKSFLLVGVFFILAAIRAARQQDFSEPSARA